MEKTKNLLTFVDGPKEMAKEKKKGSGGSRVSYTTHFQNSEVPCLVDSR